jgi:MFS family permease
MAGSVLFALCLFLLSFVGEEQFGRIFACQSLGMGLGIGLVFVPTAIIPLHYFKRQRGLTIGIVMSGGSFGGMIFPAVLRILIPKQGMGGAVRVTAYVILGFLIIANGLLGTCIPPKEEKPVYPLPRLDIAKYSKEMEYIFAAGGAFLTMLVIYYPAMYLSLLGLEHGVDPKSAFTSVIILSLTSIIGRVGFGFASDICGPWNLLIPVSGFLSLMLLTTCAVQGPKSLVAVSIFYGIFSGAWLSLLVTALSTLASRMSETGTRIGLVLSISSFGLLFSALLQDGMITPKHIWVIPSAVSGVLLIGVTALAYFSRTFLAAKKTASSRQRAKLIKGLKGFQLL